MDIWPAKFIAKRAGARLVFELHDVWPQSLIEAGGLHKFHPFVLLNGWAETVVYQSADRIVSMLPAIHNHCSSKGYDLAKVSAVSNGADMSEWNASDRSFILQTIKDAIDSGHSQKLRVVCYTGAHGVPNDLYNLLNAAKLLANEHIIFLLIGNGHHKVELAKKAQREGIENVRIGSNCTIGAVGFGYEMSEDGLYEVIPHIGNVVLERNVEIGNNVCIDRAVLGSTFLDANVKIDNLVHISHGVSIGKNSLVIAHAMIAGNVQVGEGVWIAPCSAIRQKQKIGDNALVGLGGVVVKDVEAGDTVAGVPARSLSKTK
jgi:acetyltransferase-like isoleucine patch superfamily enzyme